MKEKNNNLPIAIIGAGPIGLVVAAHLWERNKPFIVFEKGKEVGENISTWSHVSVFSPWKYNIDKIVKKLFIKEHIPLPNDEAIATGQEILDIYLKPLSKIEGITEHIHLNANVLSVGRKGLDKMKTKNREKLPFSIRVEESGKVKIYEAKAVIDASGTWDNPNSIGSGGVFATGEKENSEKIYYGMPDIKGKQKAVFAGKTVLVVGAGHSAIGSVLALDALKEQYPETTIHWLLREKDVSVVYGGQEDDGFEARGSLGIKIEELVNLKRVTVHTPVYIHEVAYKDGKLNVFGEKEDAFYSIEGIDSIVSSTGSRPDFSFLREVRFDADAAIECVPELAELIDPNIHSCGTVRPHGEAELRQKEEDFYIVGMKSYGRAPTFLMATGYEQVRSIVAHMDGDFEAAKDVQLELPETGVCSTNLVGESCCGVTSIQEEKTECCDSSQSCCSS